MTVRQQILWTIHQLGSQQSSYTTAIEWLIDNYQQRNKNNKANIDFGPGFETVVESALSVLV